MGGLLLFIKFKLFDILKNYYKIINFKLSHGFYFPVFLK